MMQATSEVNKWFIFSTLPVVCLENNNSRSADLNETFTVHVEILYALLVLFFFNHDGLK